MIQVFEIYRGNDACRNRGINWLLKSCFDILQRDNEGKKVVKELLMAECESQKASGSL